VHRVYEREPLFYPAFTQAGDDIRGNVFKSPPGWDVESEFLAVAFHANPFIKGFFVC